MALPVALLAGGALLAGCGTQNSDAVTVLTGARGSFVAEPSGLERPAFEGQRLQVGELVRSATGWPVLTTGGRRTSLAPGSELQLQARSGYALLAGSVVVDRRRGPGLVLTAAQVQVSHLGRTAIRVDRGFSVRVAVYRGGGAAVSVAARSRAVGPLSEALIPGASLPSQPAPLALRDDALDQRADPALVADDLALRRRADGLDGPGGAVVAAGLSRVVPHVLPAGSRLPGGPAPLSERLLPVAIATSARATPKAVGDLGVTTPAANFPVGGAAPEAATAYGAAQALRAAGGSWGVIAALLAAPLGAVEGSITALTDAAPTVGAGPALPAGVAAGNPLVGGLFGLGAVGGTGPSAQAVGQSLGGQSPGGQPGAGSGSGPGHPVSPVPSGGPVPPPGQPGAPPPLPVPPPSLPVPPPSLPVPGLPVPLPLPLLPPLSGLLPPLPPLPLGTG